MSDPLKHAPWIEERRKDYAETGKIVIRGTGVWTVATVEFGEDEAEQARAEAKLIIAAPELLAACVEFVRKCDAGEAFSKHSYAQMKDAIAKATS